VVTDAPAALSESRARIQAVIEASSEPLSVDRIVELTGLHHNTVRGHLDVLLALGVIGREPAGSAGRGRPRWLYRSTPSTASPFQFLAQALTVQLARADSVEIAEGAAERWASALPELPLAFSPDEAVAETTDALNRLGFNAEASPVGDAISLTGCPYAELVDDNPVICDIHTALVVRLLDQTGQPVELEAMEVWARRDMCVARLHRPDIAPSRTITARKSTITRPNEGQAS
jgi:predicted ArsR family transcriptional regulator